MPPKKKPEVSKKTVEKKKEKIIEDKTFGLKNKKGAKNQRFIQQVQKQVTTGNQPAKKAGELTKGSKKEEKKKELEELNQIFRPVAQKVDKGTDPKSVLCAFFKQGQCGKGDKCKFSHDLTVERKSEKKNIYVDVREDDLDTMDNWDEAKLAEVVEQKHGEADRKLPKTEIICKYFLDAVENNKYGWFWECPKGGDKCHYKHCLPKGFQLKKDKKKDDKKNEISIEELVETQRAALGYNLTQINLHTFLAWKKKKIKEKEDANKKDQDKKKADLKAGRIVLLSGKEMFTFKPEMAAEDISEEGEAAFDIEKTDVDDVSLRVKDLTMEDLTTKAKEADGSGTVLKERHWQNKNGAVAPPAAAAIETRPEPTQLTIDESLFKVDEDEMEQLDQYLEDLSGSDDESDN